MRIFRCGCFAADEPSEHGALILLVGDAEPRAEADVRAVLAKQLGAEGMQGPTLDALGPRSDATRQSRRDLVSCLVGERERADAGGVDLELLDEIPDAFDEAERLSGAGPGEDQRRPRWRFDGRALRRGRDLERDRCQ